MSSFNAPIDHVKISAFEIPTDAPEADGTLAWTETTLVLVEISAQGVTGIGYTYADVSTAHFIEKQFKEIVVGLSAMDIPTLWNTMAHHIRNLGRPGVTSMAISAMDNALWDLKARLLNVPLVTLLGGAREKIMAYGSGGFTSYSIAVLQKQLSGWVAEGFRAVKMKIGTHPETDLERVRAAREAIGSDADLFVDANGAYSRKQALAFAEAFATFKVSWFEEPVSSDDLEGLRLVRDRAPAGMEITSGEYGYSSVYFKRMLDGGAVDVLQADATRCQGITGFLRAADLCDAWNLPLSAHCAPSMHRHVACAAPRMRHVEYFHDHVRIEQMLFDGAATAVQGDLVPDLSKLGHGLVFRGKEAERYAVYP